MSTFYINHGSFCFGVLQPHVCVCVSGGLETSAEVGGEEVSGGLDAEGGLSCDWSKLAGL